MELLVLCNIPDIFRVRLYVIPVCDVKENSFGDKAEIICVDMCVYTFV